MIVNKRATDRVRPTFRLSLSSLRRVHKIISRPTLTRGIRRGISSVNAQVRRLRQDGFLPRAPSDITWIPRSVEKRKKKEQNESYPHRIISHRLNFFVKIRSLVAIAASDLKNGKNEKLNGRNRYEEEGKGKRTREAREDVNQTVHLRYLAPFTTAKSRINKWQVFQRKIRCASLNAP